MDEVDHYLLKLCSMSTSWSHLQKYIAKHFPYYQMYLPRVLMLLRLLATNDTAIGSTALYAALKTAKLSVMNGFQCLMSDVQEYFLLINNVFIND